MTSGLPSWSTSASTTIATPRLSTSERIRRSGRLEQTASLYQYEVVGPFSIWTFDAVGPRPLTNWSSQASGGASLRTIRSAPWPAIVRRMRSQRSGFCRRPPTPDDVPVQDLEPRASSLANPAHQYPSRSRGDSTRGPSPARPRRERTDRAAPGKARPRHQTRSKPIEARPINGSGRYIRTAHAADRSRTTCPEHPQRH